MKKFLQVLLHILGFPLLIAAVVLVSLPLIKDGISYGVFIFVGIIVVAVMAIVYYITFICMVKSKKKSITRQTLTLVIVVFVCLCGLWCVFDIALPDFLAQATSHTIFYEDLVDNYEARSHVNKALLDEYIKRNYEIGNLPSKENGGKTLKAYQDEGYRNEYVKQLLTLQFASIDGDGYASFVEPWIGMANGGRLTIPTLIHLLTDERALKENNYAAYDETAKKIKETDPLKWNVLDMLGTDMAIDLDLGEYSLAVSLALGMASSDIPKVVESILGSPIYVSYSNKQVVLTPSNASRGVLDYQSMAWLNSNGLVFAIVALLAIRNLCFIFAGWIIFSNFVIGVLRGMGNENSSHMRKADVVGGGETMSDAPQSPVNSFMPMPYPYGYVVNSVGYNITPNMSSNSGYAPPFGMPNMGQPNMGAGQPRQQQRQPVPARNSQARPPIQPRNNQYGNPRGNGPRR